MNERSVRVDYKRLILMLSTILLDTEGYAYIRFLYRSKFFPERLWVESAGSFFARPRPLRYHKQNQSRIFGS